MRIILLFFIAYITIGLVKVFWLFLNRSYESPEFVRYPTIGMIIFYVIYYGPIGNIKFNMNEYRLGKISSLIFFTSILKSIIPFIILFYLLVLIFL
jgi:hypothetical protein